MNIQYPNSNETAQLGTWNLKPGTCLHPSKRTVTTINRNYNSGNER